MGQPPVSGVALCRGPEGRAGRALRKTVVVVVNQQPRSAKFCAVCRGVFPFDKVTCEHDGALLEPVEQVLAGRYVLKNVLGSGNMGTVYRATQLPMGREVAVKLMHTDLVRNPDLVGRFEREAQAAATVDHPNAITIYDSGKSLDGQVYIAMELLEGESLSAMIERENHLSPDRALELWVPAVKAMVLAHRKGVIHRDLKPDNIFVARRLSDDGAVSELVKVLDFGIAKLIQGGKRASQTVVGARIGTAMYMSPEQLEGREASPRSDVYALGLVLIEMLTGRLPWGKTGTETDQAATMLRLINPPKRLREMCPGQVFSLELQKLLDDILAFEPQGRPADAAELISRLGAVPEAAVLAARGTRKSEGSQMFEAAALHARMGPEAQGATPLLGTFLPPRRETKSSDTPTPFLTPVPTVVTVKSLGDLRNNETPAVELPSVPTVVTGSRQDMPRFAVPGTSQRFDVPRAASQRFDVPHSASQRFDVPHSASQRFDVPTPPLGMDLPAAPTVVTASLAGRTPGAGRKSSAELKPDLPTVPLPMARHPLSTDANTIRRPNGVLPLFMARHWLTQLASNRLFWLGVGVLVAGVVALFAFRAAPKTPPKMLQKDALLVAPRTDLTAVPPVVVIPAEFPLTVEFSRKRHPKAHIICGTRPCLERCQLGPGETCTAKLMGFRLRQYGYDELKPLAQAGRVTIDLRLTRY